MSDQKTVTTTFKCSRGWIFWPHRLQIIEKIETKGWFGSTKVKVICKCEDCGQIEVIK